MPLRPVAPHPTAPLTRFMFHFEYLRADHLTSPIGVTAFSIEDGLEIIRDQWRLAEVPVPLGVDVDVDISAIPPDTWKGMVGPTNWRGVWYPYFELE